jgi:hypothetical protein
MPDEGINLKFHELLGIIKKGRETGMIYAYSQCMKAYTPQYGQSDDER